MAEAVLAFGIAANVVQFIDFGCKILSEGYELYHSGQPNSQHNQNIESVASDLEELTKSLQCIPPRGRTKQEASPNDIQLQRLAEQCRGICLELLSALEKLKVSGHSGKWSSFRTALKAVWKEKKITGLQNKLSEFRQELIVRILVTFRDEMNESTSRQASAMERLTNESNTSTRGLGEQFLDYIRQARRSQDDYLEDSRQWQRDLINAIHQDGGALLVPVSSGGQQQVSQRDRESQQSLLKSLDFSEMTDRHDRIVEAYERTFQWIYRDDEQRQSAWMSFVDWLEGDYNLYWFTGKAGSGKSTLMKYIFNDARTLKHLEAWASRVPLITAAFFFWNSETGIQMSQTGLLKSTLYQILTRSPGLIPRILPERWEAYCLFSHDDSPWREVELRRAFRLLARVDASSAKFCLFIDGLDEFDGDLTDLTDLLKDVVSSKNVKICVSSRPWIVFEDAFKTKPSLMLQDLTYPDIKHFVDSSFHKNLDFADLEKREPRYAGQLLENIAQKAAGVFLWVSLVIRSLLAGLVNGDRVSDLQRRLAFIPPDLEKLYEKMLDSLDPFYLEHASQIFQLVRAATTPPSLLCLSFADEEPEYAYECKVGPMRIEDRVSRAEIMRRRLNSRCKGLLEVNTGLEIARKGTRPSDMSLIASPSTGQHRSTTNSFTADSSVQYLHRTVKDFLETPQVWRRFEAASPQGFNPNLALFRAFLIQFKISDAGSLSNESLWEAFRKCVELAKMTEETQIEQSLTNLLDEFHRTATQLANTSIEDGSTFMQRYSPTSTSERGVLEPHWVCTDSRPWLGRSFLSLAVRADLRSYVKAKVNKDCLVRQGDDVWPLLIDAISTYPGSSLQPRDPSVVMVQTLLERGADPNWRLTTGTVWQRFIEYAMKMRFRSTTLLWAESAYHFLAHGADATLDLGSELRRSISDLSEDKQCQILDIVKATETSTWFGRRKRNPNVDKEGRLKVPYAD